MKNSQLHFGIFVLILLVQVCISQKTFNQLAGNNAWETAVNWSPPGVPSSTDDVIIPSAHQTYVVTISSVVECKSLTLGGVANTNQQQLEVTSGMLSIYGNCTVNPSGELVFSGASATGLSPTGTIIFVEGSISFTTGGAKILTSLGIIIRAGGNMLVAGQNNGLILGDSASILVSPGGNLTLSSQGGIYNNDGTATSLVNKGYFLCAPGTLDDFHTMLGITFQNLGTLSVQSGTVVIQSNGTWGGILEILGANVNISTGLHQFTVDSSIRGNGTLQVQNSARVNLQGGVSIGSFVLSGGSAVVNVDATTTSFQMLQLISGLLSGVRAHVEVLVWEGGYIVMENLYALKLQVIGSTARTMTNTSFNVQQVTFQTSTNLLLTGSIFVVTGTMTFNNQIFFICANDTSSLQIVGELLVSFPGITTLTCELGIQPGGRVNVEALAGSFVIQKAISSHGSLNISSVSTVFIESGGHTFFVDSSIIGDGTLNCQSCTAQILGHVSLGSLNFPGGTLTFQLEGGAGGGGTPVESYFPYVRNFNQSSGSSSLILINNSPKDLNLTLGYFYFGGGSISSNQNAKLQLQANLIVSTSCSFYGSYPFMLTNVAFINNGNTTFSGANAIELSQHSFIYNSPSGFFNVVTSMSASQSGQSGFVSEIQNYGLFQFSSSSTSTLGLNFNNWGNGSLVVSGAARLAITAGFFTQQDAARLTVSGLLNLQNVGLVLGGTLQGDGQIDGSVTLDGGALLVNSVSSLTITKTLLQRGNGTLVVDVSGDGKLDIQVQYQLEGGALVLFASGNIAPNRKHFVAFPSQVGSGFSRIPSATFNATLGLSYSYDATGFYSKVAPLPTILSISPKSGTTAGGTIVTISGINLDGDYNLVDVLFQGVPVPTTFGDTRSASFMVPTGTGTGLSVTYSVDGRTSNELSWSYSPPTINMVVPLHGPTLGANMVTITGTNFGDVASLVTVRFGGSANQICAIDQISENQIICEAPAGLGPNVSINVEVNQQSSSSSIQYVYDAPVLQSVYPSVLLVGDQASDQTITVTGQNLAYEFPAGDADINVTILIGANKCTSVLQTSLSTYTCVPPAFLWTASHVGYYPIVIEVQHQVSNNLTFKVVNPSSGGGSNTGKASKFAWPWPWWYFVCAGGALLFIFAIGIVVGFRVAKRPTTEAATYERINE